MEISVNYDFNDEDRKAINTCLGNSGLATQEVIEEWLLITIYATMEQMRKEARELESQNS